MGINEKNYVNSHFYIGFYLKYVIIYVCTCGEIGRRGRLKICRRVIFVWVQVPSCAPY